MKPITVSLMVRVEVQLQPGQEADVDALAARLDAALEMPELAQMVGDWMGMAVGMSLAFPLRYELDGKPLDPIAFLARTLPDESPADDESGELRAKFSRMLPGDELHLRPQVRFRELPTSARMIACKAGRKPAFEIV